MTDINFSVEFSDAILKACPELGTFDRRSSPSLSNLALHLQKGDIVRLQGVPYNGPMALLTRMWRIMDDEAEFFILLGLPSELWAPLKDHLD